MCVSLTHTCTYTHAYTYIYIYSKEDYIKGEYSYLYYSEHMVIYSPVLISDFHFPSTQTTHFQLHLLNCPSLRTAQK